MARSRPPRCALRPEREGPPWGPWCRPPDRFVLPDPPSRCPRPVRRSVDSQVCARFLPGVLNLGEGRLRGSIRSRRHHEPGYRGRNSEQHGCTLIGFFTRRGLVSRSFPRFRRLHLLDFGEQVRGENGIAGIFKVWPSTSGTLVNGSSL